MNLYQHFQHTFRRSPDRTAIRFDGREITFAELEERAGAVARLFFEHGARKGDRVAFYLGNCAELVLAHAANLRAGLVTVPMNTQYRESELGHILADSQPRLIVTDDSGLPLVQQVCGKHGGPRILLAGQLGAATGAAPPADTAGSDIAAIMYTSGTTGRSKGAMLTHENFASNITALASAWSWTADDILLLTLPLFHTHGLAVALHGALLTGCTTVLHRGFKAADALEGLQGGATLFMGVPAMYVRLLEEVERRGLKHVDLPGMRLFVSGSAPLSPETFARFKRVFGHEILERYGMTETVMNISNPCSGARIPGTVGVPLPGVAVRIVREDGTEAPPGEIGELLLRGANIFAGYWQDPDKTAQAFAVDEQGLRWFRTGDLGRIDPSTGYYRLSGRLHDLIITGGYNVYPREVEEVLLAHPAVAEAAVVGRTDDALGEVPVACVVVRGQVTEQELIDHCNARIARYKIPRAVRFIDSLPRNSMGKVDRKKLQSVLSAES